MSQQPVIRLGVVGTGYVGLTTGACFAHLGHRVTCGDVDQRKVDMLNNGVIPIVEDGLASVVDAGRAAGLLTFVLGAEEAARDADIVFLCVPTPQGDDGSADLSYIEQAARQIAPVLKPGAVVVNKSTVPVGSTVVVEAALQRPDVFVVSNPEFLREGTAVSDFLSPDRVVIGSADRGAAERVAELYAGIDAPILITDPASAETIKYAANGFLAMKISFVNAVAAMCEAVGADVAAVVDGIGSDNRIGRQFLSPGPGWGGSCFPKDSRALVKIAEEHGYNFTMMRGVIDVNDEQLERMVDEDRERRRARRRTSTGRRPRRDHGRCARPHVQGRDRRPPRVARTGDHRRTPPARRAGGGVRPDRRAANCRRISRPRSPASNSSTTCSRWALVPT